MIQQLGDYRSLSQILRSWKVTYMNIAYLCSEWQLAPFSICAPR
jgi:hypothetical protein